MKTAADLTAERIRLQGLVIEKEKELKGEVKQVKDKLNPILGIVSLFNGNKQTKSTRTVFDTGINFLIGKVIAKRVGFLPTLVIPFISKTISEQVMKINFQPYLIEALDWVIEKTDDHEVETEPPVVFKADAAFSSKAVTTQPVVIPTERVDVTS
jgi:hypothetical protein